MFFDYPSQYSYGHDDFYRALAAQRARERREAEYRARLQEARQRQQLEEALRRNAYQNYLARSQRRRSMYPYFSGFDSDEEYSPSYVYSQPTYALRQQPRSRDIYDSLRRQELATAESEPRRKNSSPKRTRSPVSAQEHESLANLHSASRSHTPHSSTSHETTRIFISPQPDIRDQAARKIQVFFRTNMPRYKSFKAISSVAQEFQSVVKNSTFPEVLDFGERSDAMELLYTSRNAPIHLHEHMLLNLLSKLDSIESHGDERVRAARKNLVKEIEGELGKLDAKKLAAWEAHRVSIIASVEGDKDSQPEFESTAMEITKEGVDEAGCSSLAEQPSVILLSEEQMETETSHQDAIEARDSNIVSSSDPRLASSDSPSSYPSDGNALSTISPNVDPSSGMDVEQPQSFETQEQYVNEGRMVNHLGTLPDVALSPSNNSVTLTSSAIPIELCV